MSKGWIGVDLDGTLAEYDGWQGAATIGKPVPKMLVRVKQWLEAKEDVRIFTARVSINNPERLQAKEAIQTWCRLYLGTVLPVTAEKDYMMKECWDDRCIQVIPNLGIAVQDVLAGHLSKERKKSKLLDACMED